MIVPQGRNTAHWLLLPSHLAKCDNFQLTPRHSLFFNISCAWLRDCAHGHVCGFQLVRACLPFRMFFFLDWSVGALLFSKLVTYFKASNWHDSAPNALRVTRGFIKACIWNRRKMLSRSRQIKQGCEPVRVLQSHRHVSRRFRPSGWEIPLVKAQVWWIIKDLSLFVCISMEHHLKADHWLMVLPCEIKRGKQWNGLFVAKW